MKTALGLTAGLVAMSANALAGPVWYDYEGHLYSLTPEAGTWLEAQAQAELEGGDLVTINSQAENDWVNSVFATDIAVWIGLYQPDGSPEPDGNWQWISKEPVTFVNWWPNQPNELLQGDNFALLNSDAFDGVWFSGEWHDVPLEGWPGPHFGIIEIGAVPEPSSLALGLLALAATAFISRINRPFS